ncbi:hypothetical protein ACFRCI_26500 [Streptomyces sp. NPDC056638]|uniref:hypothetical protein n=1 Tax=Streptomyces sp. NPDC056638 TaxID=3345887 RepID=UPI00369E1326
MSFFGHEAARHPGLVRGGPDTEAPDAHGVSSVGDTSGANGFLNCPGREVRGLRTLRCSPIGLGLVVTVQSAALPGALAARQKHRLAHRALRHSELRSAGPAPVGCGTRHILAELLPASASRMREKGRARFLVFAGIVGTPSCYNLIAD